MANNNSVSVAEEPRIFGAWLDLIYSKLEQLTIWASRNTIQKTMPECFPELKYPLTGVIVDRTQIFIEKPSY